MPRPRGIRKTGTRKLSPHLVQRWAAILRNYKDAIACIDFFTMPTVAMKVNYGFFVIHRDRRRILHFSVTYSPTTKGAIQQLRQAFRSSLLPDISY